MNLDNPQANSIMKIVDKILVNAVMTYNLQDNYVDGDHPWNVTLEESDLVMCFSYNIIKVKYYENSSLAIIWH